MERADFQDVRGALDCGEHRFRGGEQGAAGAIEVIKVIIVAEEHVIDGAEGFRRERGVRQVCGAWLDRTDSRYPGIEMK